MKKIQSTLDEFSEMLLGFWWVIVEDNKKSYDALNIIETGDYLKVYDEDGKTVLFEGMIEPDCQEAELKRCRWTQKGWKPRDWASLFIRTEPQKPLRAELMKGEKK